MHINTPPASLFWRAFLILLGTLSLAPNLISFFYVLDAEGQQRFRHVELGIEQIETLAGWGSCQRQAHGVIAGGAFAQAGGREGDRLCFQRTLEFYPYLTTAASIPLQVIGTDQKSRQLNLASQASQLQTIHWIDAIGQPVQDILFALVGILIGWRGAQQRHLRKLAMGMLLWSMLFPFFAPSWAAATLDFIAYSAQANLLAFLAFALAAPELHSSAAAPIVRLLRRTLPFYGAACLLSIGFSALVHLQAWNGQALYLIEVNRLLLSLTGYLALMTVLLHYRHLAQGQVRERIALLLPMFGLSLLVQLQPSLYFFVPAAHNQTLVLLEYVLGSLLPIGLGYAVLRHRVFDLGFALNRVLFFSLFTLLLAVAIGFAEFGVKMALQHSSWLQKYHVIAPIVSALLGIVVILGFRQIHHTLENFIENLFFHDWHVSLARFRQRVENIANVGEPDQVLQRFGAALQEYARISQMAMYLQEDLQGGRQSGADDFFLRHGTELSIYAAPAGEHKLDANHVLLSDMRGGVTFRELLDGEVEGVSAQTRQFRLALGLQVRGKLFGLVLLGAKNDGHRYRPDEIKILCQACDSIALDLDNLRVARLEKEHRQHAQEVQQLSAELEIARLQAELAQLKLTQQGKAELATP